MHGEFGLMTVLHFVDVDMWLLLDDSKISLKHIKTIIQFQSENEKPSRRSLLSQDQTPLDS